MAKKSKTDKKDAAPERAAKKPSSKKVPPAPPPPKGPRRPSDTPGPPPSPPIFKVENIGVLGGSQALPHGLVLYVDTTKLSAEALDALNAFIEAGKSQVGVIALSATP